MCGRLGSGDVSTESLLALITLERNNSTASGRPVPCTVLVNPSPKVNGVWSGMLFR